MAYELVELTTGNMIGYYDTERAALRDVADAVARYGEGAVTTLALGYDAQRGAGGVIAQGAALIARALAAFPEGSPPVDGPKSRQAGAAVGPAKGINR